MDKILILSPPNANLLYFLGQWIRSAARIICKKQKRILRSASKLDHPLTVVCISDTLNQQPYLPPGDILLHSGDLTEHGTFDELQAQLEWLSSQPHMYKIMIAGEHDALLDPTFSNQFPNDYPNIPGKTVADLRFGSVIYLRDSSVTIDFPEYDDREVAIYGCPTISSEYASAFWVPHGVNIWAGAVPQGTDVIMSHGPPWNHLDGNVAHVGCHFLGMEIKRIKPRLVVFGHEHAGYGKEEIDHSQLSQANARRVEESEKEREVGRGVFSQLQMTIMSMWRRLGERFECFIFRYLYERPMLTKGVTTLINASLVDGFGKEKRRNYPIVTYI